MNWTGRPRSLRVTHRISAFIVALLWCAAPVLAGIHAGVEAHRYCAEHGAVEEAGEATGDVVASEHGRVGGTGESERTASHEGCAFARFCRFGWIPGQHIPEATGKIEATGIAAPSLPRLASPVDVIRIAPKTSPPV